jgi:Arc/MetJ family transcription regulator
MTTSIYTGPMNHLIDLDEDALAAARAALGTATIRATVNEALRRAADNLDREARIQSSLDSLASMPALDRSDAWA